MQIVAKYSKNEKSISIVKIVKEGTNRIFFYPVTAEGFRLTRTNFSRKWEAVSLAKIYLNQ